MSSRSIPFFNYPALSEKYLQEFTEIFQDILGRGAYILQRDLAEFESAFAEFLGAKFAFGVADGTNAIYIALRACDIGPGDEVIVPSHTYIATAGAVQMVGATPVLADCGPDHLLDAPSVRAKLTPRTKAFIPVHLNGRTCEMEPLLTLAEEKGLLVIEDTAQGVGAKLDGKAAGTFGVAGTFSFYPAKILGCFGDGGGVCTNDPRLAEKLSQLRDHGRNKDGLVVSWGTNSRLDNLHAAFLKFKLERLPEELERRRAIARHYQERLSKLEDLALPPPPEEGRRYDVFQNYELEAGHREELRKFLESKGVRTIMQWAGRAVHHFKLGLPETELPHTEEFFKRCFMLPLHTALTDGDVDYVCDAIEEFYG